MPSFIVHARGFVRETTAELLRDRGRPRRRGGRRRRRRPPTSSADPDAVLVCSEVPPVSAPGPSAAAWSCSTGSTDDDVAAPAARGRRRRPARRTAPSTPCSTPPWPRSPPVRDAPVVSRSRPSAEPSPADADAPPDRGRAAHRPRPHQPRDRRRARRPTRRPSRTTSSGCSSASGVQNQAHAVARCARMGLMGDALVPSLRRVAPGSCRHAGSPWSGASASPASCSPSRCAATASSRPRGTTTDEHDRRRGRPTWSPSSSIPRPGRAARPPSSRARASSPSSPSRRCPPTTRSTCSWAAPTPWCSGDTATDEVVARVELVGDGGAVVPRGGCGSCSSAPASAGRASPRGDDLTPREHQILHSIDRGESVKQTARALGISPKTVENLQSRLFTQARRAQPRAGRQPRARPRAARRDAAADA